MSLFRSVFCLTVLMILSGFPVSMVYAGRSMTISSSDITLGQDAEMLVAASVSGFTDGETVYVKGAFYKDGSTNYFGYTKSGSEWIRNSAPNLSQLKSVIGTWDTTLRVKSDYGDSGYSGEGDYLFKVRFYYGDTGSGWSENALPVFIHAPDPTATTIPTPTATVTPIPVHTEVPHPSVTPVTVPPSPTNIPSVTVRQVETPHSGITGSFGILEPEESYRSTSSAEVLGFTENTGDPDNVRTVRPWVFGLLFVGIGLALLSSALAYRNSMIWKNMQQHNSL